jgi:hypothetical protein
VVSVAQAKSSNAGLVAVKYSGRVSDRFVYQSSNPSLWNTALEFRWTEIEVAVLRNGAAPKVLTSSLTVFGGERESYSSPNQPSCTSYFHRRRGSIVPVFIDSAGAEVSAHALLPITGSYLQSNVADNSKPCGVAMNSGPSAALNSPSNGTDAAAEDPLAELTLGGAPVTKDFKADLSDANGTSALDAELSATAVGTCKEFSEVGFWGRRTVAAAADFRNEVIVIRQSGQNEQAKIADVERITASYLAKLKRAFEQDQRDLNQIKQQVLADAACDRALVKEQVDAAQAALDGAYRVGQGMPERAIDSIKDGCGCGGFGPPNLS